MKTILNLLLVTCFINSSLFAQTAKLKEKFDIQKNKTVKIAGTDLELKVLSNGHFTYYDWSHTYFCKIEVKLNGAAKESELNLGESLIFENLNIRLIGLKESYLLGDLTWSASSCKFIVVKNKK